jgi:hypothetical protein
VRADVPHAATVALASSELARQLTELLEGRLSREDCYAVAAEVLRLREGEAAEFPPPALPDYSSPRHRARARGGGGDHRAR